MYFISELFCMVIEHTVSVKTLDKFLGDLFSVNF